MRSIALTLIMILLAGCIQLDPSETDASQVMPDSVLRLAEHDAPLGQALTWIGSELATDPDAPDECGPHNCEVIEFQIKETINHTEKSVLQLTIDWNTTDRRGDFDQEYQSFRVDLHTPDGNTQGNVYTYTSKVTIDNPKPGDYQAVVRILPSTAPQILERSADYNGAILIHEPQQPDPDAILLPDLVLNRLEDLTLEYASPGEGHMLGLPGVWAPHTTGCGVDEAVEQQAERCLRFLASIGNAGDGPLRLGYTDTTMDRATEADVQAVQCIHKGDGSGILQDAGTGNYHLYHLHHHQQDILSFAVHDYDEATGTIGDERATNQKFGFGFFRQALLGYGTEPVWPADVTRPAQCGDEHSWYHLNPGWYDPYPRWRTGNMIDLSGLDDGTYLLKATVNPLGLIEEKNSDNNTATVVFELDGDTVRERKSWVWGP